MHLARYLGDDGPVGNEGQALAEFDAAYPQLVSAADYAIAGKAMMGSVLIATILFMPDGILLRVLRLFGYGRRPAPVARSQDVMGSAAHREAVPTEAPALAAKAPIVVGLAAALKRKKRLMRLLRR